MKQLRDNQVIMSDNFFVLCQQLGKACVARGVCIAIAESCTGGTVASVITDAPGSSAWFNGSAVVYSNLAKTNLLNVSSELIQTHGAVSEPVAIAMANGALEKFQADVAVSITGVAGPAGGTKEKPVGMVCIALADKKQNATIAKTVYFTSGREYIRRCATAFVLQWLIAAI